MESPSGDPPQSVGFQNSAQGGGNEEMQRNDERHNMIADFTPTLLPLKPSQSTVSGEHLLNANNQIS